jgi:hypothetical protein
MRLMTQAKMLRLMTLTMTWQRRGGGMTSFNYPLKLTIRTTKNWHNIDSRIQLSTLSVEDTRRKSLTASHVNLVISQILISLLI